MSLFPEFESPLGARPAAKPIVVPKVTVAPTAPRATLSFLLNPFLLVVVVPSVPSKVPRFTERDPFEEFELVDPKEISSKPSSFIGN